MKYVGHFPRPLRWIEDMFDSMRCALSFHKYEFVSKKEVETTVARCFGLINYGKVSGVVSLWRCSRCGHIVGQLTVPGVGSQDVPLPELSDAGYFDY